MHSSEYYRDVELRLADVDSRESAIKVLRTIAEEQRAKALGEDGVQ